MSTGNLPKVNTPEVIHRDMEKLQKDLRHFNL
jgi:hypothetical protein